MGGTAHAEKSGSADKTNWGGIALLVVSFGLAIALATCNLKPPTTRRLGPPIGSPAHPNQSLADVGKLLHPDKDEKDIEKKPAEAAPPENAPPDPAPAYQELLAPKAALNPDGSFDLTQTAGFDIPDGLYIDREGHPEPDVAPYHMWCVEWKTERTVLWVTGMGCGAMKVSRALFAGKNEAVTVRVRTVDHPN